MKHPKLATSPGIRVASSHPSQVVSTPLELLAACQLRFGEIVFDLAALDNGSNSVVKSQEGGKCWNGPLNNSLDPLTEWPSTHYKRLVGSLPFWLWCNPPFANISKWAERCSAEYITGKNIMLLVPASVDSNWYRKFVEPVAIVEFLNPRITFSPNTEPYPKPMMLALFSRALRVSGFQSKGCSQWQWKEYLKQERGESKL